MPTWKATSRACIPDAARPAHGTTSLTPITVITVSVGLAVVVQVLFRARQALLKTTLRSAWLWAMMAFVAWAAAWVSDHGLHVASKSLADHLWYGSAVLALCPPIAVLGSRRPGTRVWTWFIQLPLLLVLGWPVLSLWLQGSELRGLQLETPQLVAYLLVLIMGAGNYCGTRFTLPAVGFAVACAFLAVSSSAACPMWLANREASRMWSTGLLVVAVLLASRSHDNSALKRDRFDQLWLDYFDTFGVVWGRRIQDRINFIAEQEGWLTRLELHGFVWTDTAAVELADQPVAEEAASESQPSRATTTRAATEARLEHTFRWLLRRFVDPPWIDQRLGSSPVANEVGSHIADS